MISLGYATTTCHVAYSCDGDEILETSTGNVQCFGYHSCYQSSITTTGESSILCFGSYSCYQSSYLQIQNTVNQTHYQIACFGLFSCAFVELIYLQFGPVFCYGELSCFNSNIYIGDSGNRYGINIRGDRACVGSILSGGFYNWAYASLSAQNATFISTIDNATFEMYANFAGYGATIICGDELNCYVYCSGNGCNQLTLECAEHNDTCNFIIDCKGAQQSDICPNGYNLDQLSFQVPSLTDVELSSYENSYNPCFSAITNAINCGDSFECEYSNSLIDINAPICCTGNFACINSGNITTIGIKLNLTIIDNTAIRCDGYQSCDEIGGIIMAKNGGNIYFAGRDATHVGGTSIISTSNKYSIICSGSLSCFNGKTFHSAMNLFCTGSTSCYNSIIKNISFVYMYGLESGHSSIMDNIYHSVYCNAYLGCENSVISNVGKNVFGGGYQVLYNSQITNATNVCKRVLYMYNT